MDLMLHVSPSASQERCRRTLQTLWALLGQLKTPSVTSGFHKLS